MKKLPIDITLLRSFFLLIASVMLRMHASAQQVYPVTDSEPALLNGLQAGYTITGESEKEVGDKGEFSRYKLKFYVTNTTTEAKILFWVQPGDAIIHADRAVPELVRFVCQNATGARFTSKECSLSAAVCNLEVMVEDKDGRGNAGQTRRIANLGYWIRPGETISSNTIMIVPLGQRPQVNAIFFPVTHSFGASIPTPTQPSYNAPQPGYGTPASPYSPPFVRFRNMTTGSYLTGQNGQVSCTAHNQTNSGYNQNDQDWGRTEWELQPVAGTNYFLIRNRLQHTYLNAENAGMLSDNSQSRASLWSIDQSYNSSAYRIRNAWNNATLVFQNGSVTTSGNSGMQDNSACWIIERE